MKRRPSIAQARFAFTLIELLTVIAIIGILAAILIPTVAKVRALAHNTACKSNLRQWGVALQLYSNDNKQRIPYEGSDDYLLWGAAANPTEGNAWFNVLPPYANYAAIKDLKTGIGGMSAQERNSYFQSQGRIYRCGADQRALSTLYMAPSYMINSQLYESHSPVGKGGPDNQLTLNHLKSRSSTPLSHLAFLADAGIEKGQCPRLRGHENGALTVEGVDYRHGGSFNVVFFDASVRQFARHAHDPSLVWNPWVQ